MKINEAVAKAMLNNERAFKDISETQATRIVKAALTEIAQEIDEMEDGRVSVPGFATFAVKQVEREKEGKTVSLKRILVRLRVRKSDADESADAVDDDGDDD